MTSWLGRRGTAPATSSSAVDPLAKTRDTPLPKERGVPLGGQPGVYRLPGISTENAEPDIGSFNYASLYASVEDDAAAEQAAAALEEERSATPLQAVASAVFNPPLISPSASAAPTTAASAAASAVAPPLPPLPPTFRPLNDDDADAAVSAAMAELETSGFSGLSAESAAPATAGLSFHTPWLLPLNFAAVGGYGGDEGSDDGKSARILRLSTNQLNEAERRLEDFVTVVAGSSRHDSSGVTIEEAMESAFRPTVGSSAKVSAPKASLVIHHFHSNQIPSNKRLKPDGSNFDESVLGCYTSSSIRSAIRRAQSVYQRNSHISDLSLSDLVLGVYEQKGGTSVWRDSTALAYFRDFVIINYNYAQAVSNRRGQTVGHLKHTAAAFATANRHILAGCGCTYRD